MGNAEQTAARLDVAPLVNMHQDAGRSPKLLRRLMHDAVFGPYRFWCRGHLRRFERATKRIRDTQRAILCDRLGRNRDTGFGRDHGFAGISTVADFRRQVPIAPYEYYEPYVDRLKAGDTSALLGAGQKLVMFALTSGTHTARKFIPITDEFVRAFRRGWLVWGVKCVQDYPKLLYGSIVQLTSDWDEFRTAAGIPCGSVSGLVAQMQRAIVRRLYAVPAEVGRIKDVSARHYTTLRLAVARDVSYITTANPASVINLARLGNTEKESLVRDVADGTLSERFRVPRDVRERIERRIGRPDRTRARVLEGIIARTGSLLPKDYWPNLALLGNWTGGAMGVYLRALSDLFGSVPVRDIGLIASEGRMTVPLESGTPSGVLDVTTNYYEFIPAEEIDSDAPTVLEAHELVEGRNYFILLTTPSGFYRYNISDVVRVNGRFHQAPVLEFLNRGSHCSSITGEKLTESQVCRAVDWALGKLSLSLGAFTLAPCWDDALPYYRLLIERSNLASREQAIRLARLVDAALCCLNTEYENKRQTLRLGPVRLTWVRPGSWQEFCRRRLEQTGGTIEQYKHPCLVNDLGFAARIAVEQELTADDFATAYAEAIGLSDAELVL